MSMAIDPIKVDNLKNMLAAMKQLEVDVPTKVIRVALNKAAELVVKDAKARTPTLTGNARASIRAASTASSAKVSGGSAKVPYFGFVDYGNKVKGGRGGVGRGDTMVRPFIKTGRILYPAFHGQRLAVVNQMDAALNEALRNVGLAVDE